MQKALQRLLPPRLSERKAQTSEERLRLFGSVSDNDPCLKALYDLLDDVIESNANAAFNCQNDIQTQQVGWLHVGFCRQLMMVIEDERARGNKMLLGIKEEQ